jgi:hypothetical protein
MHRGPPASRNITKRVVFPLSTDRTALYPTGNNAALAFDGKEGIGGHVRRVRPSAGLLCMPAPERMSVGIISAGTPKSKSGESRSWAGKYYWRPSGKPPIRGRQRVRTKQPPRSWGKFPIRAKQRRSTRTARRRVWKALWQQRFHRQ